MKGRPNCRILPNGQFSLWRESDFKVEPPTKTPDYLGLSLLPNSHKVLLGLAEPTPERGQRGLNGISSLGTKTVKNGCFLLERKHGRQVLSFLTCTIPGDACQSLEAGREWAEIVRQFLQSLRRLLKAAGLPGSIVGVTEIQMKRYRERGGMPLHLHLVFQGRKPGGPWSISISQFDALWRRAVTNRVESLAATSFASACNVQRVKQSAEGYLGKYLSKGASALAAVLKDDPAIAEFLPRSWWFCSQSLKRAIVKATVAGSERAEQLYRQMNREAAIFDFVREVAVEMPDGATVAVAMVGRLNGFGRRLMGVHEATERLMSSTP